MSEYRPEEGSFNTGKVRIAVVQTGLQGIGFVFGHQGKAHLFFLQWARQKRG